jgi:ribose-phosphate pyrophosphokinase
MKGAVQPSESSRMREIVVFAGSSHRELAQEICARLGVGLSPMQTKRFSNDCLEVQLQANCRERDVFLIQTLSAPVQEHLMELLLMVDAARGASAARITVVLPFYAYARSDKKDAPRISIGGRLVADLLSTAGASRVLTMALHAPQVHSFFSVPVDNLHALNELAAHFQGLDLANTIVVSPDLGYAKSAMAFARRLGLDVAIAPKQRLSDTEVRIGAIIGETAGRDVIIVDDEIAGGTTILALLARLRERGVGQARIACTHGLFGRDAVSRLASQPGVLEIVTTNTVPVAAEKRIEKLTVLSIAPSLAEAMRRIHEGESVSELFG